MITFSRTVKSISEVSDCELGEWVLFLDSKAQHMEIIENLNEGYDLKSNLFQSDLTIIAEFNSNKEFETAYLILNNIDSDDNRGNYLFEDLDDFKDFFESYKKSININNKIMNLYYHNID